MKRAARCGAVVLVLTCACGGPGGGPSPLPPPPAGPGPGGGPTVNAPPVTFVGAGDIANCDTIGARETAKLLDVLGGTIFTTGDNAYPGGTADEFRRCYDPTWGRHRARTRPSPGNHDYNVPGAAAYFSYFGQNAGPPGLGYYSFDLGAWHVISLNSEIAAGAGSAQEQWLRLDLEANRAKCTVAYWHRPLFSSGHGTHTDVRALWRALYEFDADLVLAGHDHFYERFAPQNPDGRPDAARGIRQITVGTGGTVTHQRRAAAPNSEAFGTDWGVLALTLEANGYRWEFVPVAGAVFRDTGTGSCH